MAAALQRSLEKQGIKFRFKTIAESAKVVGGKVQVSVEERRPGAGWRKSDKVLVCVGRRPVTDGLGLAEVGRGDWTSAGSSSVDPHYRHQRAGRLRHRRRDRRLMLAHKAEEEGIAAVELMAGKPGHVNYHACPSVVYTHPELAQVGLTEEDAAQARPDQGRQISPSPPTAGPGAWTRPKGS